MSTHATEPFKKCEISEKCHPKNLKPFSDSAHRSHPSWESLSVALNGPLYPHAIYKHSLCEGENGTL